jgi:AAA domain-containing protein
VPTTPVQVLLLSGPGGVGKSTLGWEVATQLRRLGIAHVLLDSDELDRAWPLTTAERDRLNRANLTAFWANAAALGHSRLLFAGVFLNAAAARDWITACIPVASIIRVVLDTSDDELERRVRAREIGSEADEQWERTLAQARGFRRRNAGSADVLDTTGRAVPDLARQVIERTGWAGQAAQARDRPAATETS